MTREITTHIVNGDAASQLKLEVLDDPGAGGANHLYHITGFNSASNISDPWTVRHGQSAEHSTILFQNGPIKEAGANGVTQEVLLAIVIDRLECFQKGPFASDYNASALSHAQLALIFLKQRTRDRIARDVEGQNVL